MSFEILQRAAIKNVSRTENNIVLIAVSSLYAVKRAKQNFSFW